MLSLVRVLGFEEINFSPAIEFSHDYLSLAQRYLKNFSGPFISILPGAGHPYKMWGKEKFAASLIGSHISVSAFRKAIGSST